MGTTDTIHYRKAAPEQEAEVLSSSDFSRLSAFIHQQYGIKMPEAKKVMLQARLQKRLKTLHLNSFREYCDYLFSDRGMEEEVVSMIDLVTTNKTDFFREAHHFRYLVDAALPRLLKAYGVGKAIKLSVWSAGCSTGEEPYTIAMVIDNFARQQPLYGFQIVGTDISTTVLEKARTGIYEEEKVAPVPPEFKKKYLLRSKETHKRIVRIAPELRAMISFRRLNFMDNDYGDDCFHIIFCRNVIIYFDRQTQEQLLRKICRRLVTDGFLFMGHSETLHGMDLPLSQAGPTIYRKLA